MGWIEFMIVSVAVAVVSYVVRMWLERKGVLRPMAAATDTGSSSGLATGTQSDSVATAVLYRHLLGRYRPAYRAASNLANAAAVLLLGGAVGAIWGTVWLNSGYARQEAAAPLLMVAGFLSLVAGFALRVLASFLRANLDRTCYLVPGLSDEERLRLASEAGGMSLSRSRTKLLS